MTLAKAQQKLNNGQPFQQRHKNRKVNFNPSHTRYTKLLTQNEPDVDVNKNATRGMNVEERLLRKGNNGNKRW